MPIASATSSASAPSSPRPAAAPHRARRASPARVRSVAPRVSLEARVEQHDRRPEPDEVGDDGDDDRSPSPLRSATTASAEITAWAPPSVTATARAVRRRPAPGG